MQLSLNIVLQRAKTNIVIIHVKAALDNYDVVEGTLSRLVNKMGTYSDLPRVTISQRRTPKDHLELYN